MGLRDKESDGVIEEAYRVWWDLVYHQADCEEAFRAGWDAGVRNMVDVSRGTSDFLEHPVL